MEVKGALVDLRRVSQVLLAVLYGLKKPANGRLQCICKTWSAKAIYIFVQTAKSQFMDAGWAQSLRKSLHVFLVAMLFMRKLDVAL